MVANFYNDWQLWWSGLWYSKLSTSSLAFSYRQYILEWNISFRPPLKSVKNTKDKKTKLCLLYLLVHSDFILFFGNLTCLLNPDIKGATEKLCCELFENIISKKVLLWGERKRHSSFQSMCVSVHLREVIHRLSMYLLWIS